VTDQIPLPSTRTLLRSTAIAAVVAAVILVTLVLPAEYAVDPTGIGRVLGLTEMGEIKTSLATEAGHQPAVPPCPEPAVPVKTAPAPTPAEPAPAAPPAERTDVTRVTLKPGQAKEVKLAMRGGARATFSWSTDTGVVNYDLHSDDPTGAYHGYGKATGVRQHQGTLVAAFDGLHGWFWRNRTKADVTITLETRGDYTEVRIYD
jgi:hypothetical protein